MIDEDEVATRLAEAEETITRLIAAVRVLAAAIEDLGVELDAEVDLPADVLEFEDDE